MAGDFPGADITEALEPPAHLNTDDSARAMLGTLHDFGDLMSRLGLLYTNWCDHPAARGGWHRQPKFGDGFQEGAGDPLINKLNPLNWGMMDDAYQRLDNAHTAALAIGSAARQGFDQLHAGWRSDAGENAARFNDLHSAARHYADQLESLAGQLKGVRETTRDAVRRLADFADESADAQEAARDRKLAYDRGIPDTPTVDVPAADPTGDLAMAITRGIVSLFSSDQELSLLERWQDYANQLRVVLADGAYSDYLCPQGTLTTRQGFGARVPVSTADLRAPGRLVVHSESGSVWGDQVVN
ncbi:MAG: WXG100 family type VII secretion target, partial [Sciscionella sp.]